MLMLQTGIMTLVKQKLNLLDIINILNNMIFSNMKRIQQDKCSTLSIIQFDKKSKNFKITGYHETFIIFKDNNKIIENTHHLGIQLGLLENVDNLFQEKSFKLDTSDILFLYTDGSFESIKNNVYYDIEHVEQIVKINKDKTSNDILNLIVEDYMLFKENEDLQDDITFIVVKLKY